MASIIIISGAHRGAFYRLGQTTNVIGRDETLPIQIVDERISRRHMEIRFDRRSSAYSAVDLGSTNGVLINGSRIDNEIVLSDGDCIRIGQTSFMFTVKDFFDRESTLGHIRKFGEWERHTKTE